MSIDIELGDLPGPDRLAALKADIVRIVESRGGEVTELPRPREGRRRAQGGWTAAASGMRTHHRGSDAHDVGVFSDP